MATLLKDKEFERELKALANARRLAILRCLKGKDQISVTEISERIKLSFRSTSKHLAVLRAAGIVDFEIYQVQRYYRLSDNLGLSTRQALEQL